MDIKPGFLAPPGTLEKKPPHGAPCNRCGLCCIATVCPLGANVFKQQLGPCPALEPAADGTYGCGLIASPATYAPARAFVYGTAALREAAVHLIGSGIGCDARFNGEPVNQKFYDQLHKRDMSQRSKTNAAKRTWGVPC